MKRLGKIVAVIVLAIATLLGTMRAGLWNPSYESVKAAQATAPSTFVKVGTATLHMRDEGPRTGPVIVMLHSSMTNLREWDAWADALTDKYRVIRFDLPGFGLTGSDPTGDYSDARAIRVLAGLMDQLGIARAAIVGNSLGGRIAWTFAAQQPDRVTRLVLVSPDGFASPGFAYDKAPDVPLMMQALPYTAPRAMLKANLAVAYAHPDRLAEATVTRYRDMMLAPGVRRAILARMDQTILHDPVPDLSRIKTPTLLLWGEKDGMIPISNAADYLRAMPDATLVRLTDFGHVPFEEDPAKSLVPVERFLAGGGG